jgi:hypothetical protein
MDDNTLPVTDGQLPVDPAMTPAQDDQTATPVVPVVEEPMLDEAVATEAPAEETEAESFEDEETPADTAAL